MPHAHCELLLSCFITRKLYRISPSYILKVHPFIDAFHKWCTRHTREPPWLWDAIYKRNEFQIFKYVLVMTMSGIVWNVLLVVGCVPKTFSILIQRSNTMIAKRWFILACYYPSASRWTNHKLLGFKCLGKAIRSRNFHPITFMHRLNVWRT